MPLLHPDLFVPHLVSLLGAVDGLRTLDAGCGRGRNTLFLARLGAVVTGVDHAPEMVAACRRSATAEGLKVCCVAGVAETLPFASNCFDLALCTSVLESMGAPAAAAAAAELHRVVRPGGHLLVVTAALEGSEAGAGGAPPYQARLTSRKQLARWFGGWRTAELLHLRLVEPASAAVSAQWALIARRAAG